MIMSILNRNARIGVCALCTYRLWHIACTYLFLVNDFTIHNSFEKPYSHYTNNIILHYRYYWNRLWYIIIILYILNGFCRHTETRRYVYTVGDFQVRLITFFVFSCIRSYPLSFPYEIETVQLSCYLTVF